MNHQYPGQDLDEFLRLLAASQLLDDAVIESALSGFRTFKADGDSRSSADCQAFASFLAVHGYLTCWQSKKVYEGRFKGFFLDNYKLRDHVGVDDTCSRYLAEDTGTGRLVILAITPPTIAPRQEGKPHYRVEDYGA